MLKNTLKGALLVLMTTGAAHAGDDGFGIKGGVGFSSLSFEENDLSDQKNRMKIGGQVGFSFEKFLTKKENLSIDIEALLASKGVQQKSETTLFGNTYKTNVKTNLYTVDVPLSIKFYPIERLNIYAGPYYSYIAAAQFRTITQVNDEDKKKEDGENWFDDKYDDPQGDKILNRHDVGIHAGIEFISEKGFGIGARFQKGFMDLTNEDYLLGDGKKVTNTALQVYGIIRF